MYLTRRQPWVISRRPVIIELLNFWIYTLDSADALSLMSGHESSTKAILYALLANFGIAIIKTFAAIFTGSGSMLAEAIHSYADTGNQLLLFLGIYRSKKEPDSRHPLGYGKAIYFWSFIVAIMLFSLGGLFSIYEGIHKLSVNSPLEDAWIALTVLGISILLEGGSLIGATREINKKRKNKSLWRWLNESRNAELVVVFGEDLAALSGLTMAFGFILMASYTGNSFYDAMGSIVIGVILLIVSVFVGFRVKDMLLGQSADSEIEKTIYKIINSRSEIETIFRILTIQNGPDIVLSAKVEFAGNPGVREASSIINEIEKEIKRNIPSIKWIFVEPDIED